MTSIKNYCIACKSVARDDCEDRGHVVGTLGQDTGCPTAPTQPAPETDGEWRTDKWDRSGLKEATQRGIAIGRTHQEFDLVLLLEMLERIETLERQCRAVPLLVATLKEVEAAFFEDAGSGGIVERGKFMPLDDKQHPWIPGAKAWPVIEKVRAALAAVSREEQC